MKKMAANDKMIMIGMVVQPHMGHNDMTNLVNNAAHVSHIRREELSERLHLQ